MQEFNSMVKDPIFLKRLRIVSLLEGCSTLILFFIAIPLKYGLDMPQAVSWPGRIHGGLFFLLVALAVIAVKKVPLPPKLSFILIVAAILPFGPFVVDRKLKAISA
jgi:integral membrane protein